MDATHFVDLLNSQQDNVLPQPFPQPFPFENFSQAGELGSSQVPVFSTQCTETSSFCEDSATQRKERKKWSPSDDLVLISAWLNTSKDPVVGNEQKAGAFWKRIAAYYAASPRVDRGDQPEAIQCKQRWQKMNDLVCKFCGSYAAATRQKTSGQSESDVVKVAHNIFFNDHKIKFNLHHAWEELRHDQKWCDLATNKMTGSAKKRKCEDGTETASSQATTNVDDQPTKRHAGVKAAKAASSKKPVVDEEVASEFQTI
ncbi:hypothetical protein N665_0953s0005 [Sinapis alba]|nr:hypothetical protein N665_0953s0005 [Sinapis alba]